MMRVLRPVITLAGLLALWQIAFHVAGERAYLLPAPLDTLTTAIDRADRLAHHALITFGEILLGFGFGVALGMLSALVLVMWAPARRWLLPLLVISQAIPVFALAPLLVLWLGYGLSSKVVMAVLIIYFPVTTAFLDGLRRTDPAWLDMARVMGAGRGAMLWHIRLPAALPALASGLRVAAAVAPIGAVVGEWVGSSAGLGFLMLHANARMQIDVVFAALFLLAAFAVALYALVNALTRRMVPWQAESNA
ncbi:ABC transporter permease [Roseospira visakhapatnamensis]|uniref:Putative hydroxymethylpyrimidine transport system permease protein n=1 Tax=Roseospira visakhapatnamensis TaxID=390880 RepID=A0A7W6WAE9_9PROT|nr:ABC transporter permease [Roseospira visakhapatnamensis]MBB4266778.1 putative hydroxymethylpyrimidine transport system permease protein [Roseospira visakhapatnamensis]